MKGLSVGLPCYNEAESLPRILESYRTHIAEGARAPFELILVNNGSTDDTARVLAQIVQLKGYEFARVVTVERNQGYGYGLLAGLETARYDYIGFSHADGQCSPSDVLRAFTHLGHEPHCLIKGARRGRSLGSVLFSRTFEVLAFLLLRRRLYEINAQPKIFPRMLLDYIRVDAPTDFAFDLHVLLRAIDVGLPLRSFPVQFPPRLSGMSHWSSTFRSRLRHSSALIKFMRNYTRISPSAVVGTQRRRAENG